MTESPPAYSISPIDDVGSRHSALPAVFTGSILILVCLSSLGLDECFAKISKIMVGICVVVLACMMKPPRVDFSNYTAVYRVWPV